MAGFIRQNFWPSLLRLVNKFLPEKKLGQKFWLVKLAVNSTLDMLCTELRRVSLRIIKTNHKQLVYKTFQGRNLSNIFGGILDSDII